jgi:hypothetical protein
MPPFYAFTTDGLAPGNPMSLIQASEMEEEAALLRQRFAYKDDQFLQNDRFLW